MLVRRTISVVIACLAMLAGAGCSDRDRTPRPAETDEPLYVQGKQLMKQGRNPEALTAFLKVIDRRGEVGAPESHLEAGYIYLHHTKDPVEAYHHFRRYLALRPNSDEAAGVRGKVEDALREFARTLPARPLDDQSAKLAAQETIERLQRKVEELSAQVATLRGGGAGARTAPMITVPEEALPASTPPPINNVADPRNPTAQSAPLTSRPTLSVPTSESSTAQSRTAPPTRPATPTGRTHTVVAKDTLFGISMKYYGNGRQVDAIYQANRNIMRDRTDLRPGMVLRIP